MTLFSNAIDLIIFDCDGVLIDSEVISAQVIVEMLEREGVKINLQYVYKNFLGQQFVCVKKNILQKFSVKLPDSFESDYRQELLLAFKQNLQPTSGIKDIISSLNVTSCVATSSSSQRTEGALKLVGLDDAFGGCVFTASQVERGKPAPDLFLFTAEKMQVEPKRCLVIEDSLTGIKAAVAAGMNVVRYAGASHFKNNTDELPEQLSQVTIFKHWQHFYKMLPYLKK